MPMDEEEVQDQPHQELPTKNLRSLIITPPEAVKGEAKATAQAVLATARVTLGARDLQTPMAPMELAAEALFIMRKDPTTTRATGVAIKGLDQQTPTRRRRLRVRVRLPASASTSGRIRTTAGNAKDRRRLIRR